MSLFHRSLITALLFGVWSWSSGALGLVTWAGAAGCTAYFASSGGKDQAVRASLSISSGIFWAVLSLWLAQKSVDSSLLMAVTTLCMCMQTKFCKTFYTPAVFMGCFSVFAAGKVSVPFLISVFTGVGIGLASDSLAELIYLIKGKKIPLQSG